MKYDVAIIGAGIAGSLMAYRLAKKGISVVLVEAGDKGEERHVMVERYAKAIVKIPSSPYNDGISYSKAPAPIVVNDTYYDQKGPDKFKSTYLRRTGGTTWHWLGNVPRLLPNDFKIKSVYGVGCDWPLDYEELEPWYCEAEEEIGVSGNHEEWNGLHGAFRSKVFPMPPIALSYSDGILYEKLNRQVINGRKILLNSTPQARNSEAYDGRAPCIGSSSCVPICPIGAKYDATVHVSKAVEAGAILQERLVATKIVGNESGNAVELIECRTWEGEERTITATTYVLATHTIESAKLLLISGIANSSDQVGRNLMDHLNGAAGAILPEPVFPFRGPPTTSGIDTFRDGEFRREEAAFRMSMGNNAWGRMESPDKLLNNLVREKGVFGKDLQKKFRERMVRMFRISYSTEMLPDLDNRITLSSELDSNNIPKPELHFKVGEYNYRTFETAREVISGIFDELGAVETRFETNVKKYKGAGHIIGTCKMGDNPKCSVVNRDCRSHDLHNLYVVGASVFPTGGTANPTLTAAALALRAADTIATGLIEI